MVWKGAIIEESLEDKSLLEFVKVVGTVEKEFGGEVVHFNKIELEESKKEEFIQKAMKSVKSGFYAYIVMDKLMYVLYPGRMFKFSRGYPELEKAKMRGELFGISKDQMPYEKFIEEPYYGLD